MFDFSRSDLSLMGPNDVLALAADGEFYSAVLFKTPYTELSEDEKVVADRCVDLIEHQKIEHGLVVKWGRFVEANESVESDLVWFPISNTVYVPMHRSAVADDPANTYYEFI